MLSVFPVSAKDRTKYQLTDALIDGAYAAVIQKRAKLFAEVIADVKTHSCALCEDPTRVWRHDVGAPTKAAASPAECINNHASNFGQWPLTVLDVLQELSIPC